MNKVVVYGNSLTSLPPDIATIPLSSSIRLDNNPWECSCENSWMSEWLHSVKQSIKVDSLLCNSPARLNGKSIMKISHREFCYSEETPMAVIFGLSSAVSVVVVSVSVVTIVYRLRVKLFTTWNFHPFDRDECAGEDMDYDVFLSCSSDDNLPHGNDIRQKLEQSGYRICYPPRDFVVGELIFVNIDNAVVRSKRTVCLLTSHFLQRSGRLMLPFIVSIFHLSCT